jgi:hypothetical protein
MATNMSRMNRRKLNVRAYIQNSLTLYGHILAVSEGRSGRAHRCGECEHRCCQVCRSSNSPIPQRKYSIQRKGLQSAGAVTPRPASSSSAFGTGGSVSGHLLGSPPCCSPELGIAPCIITECAQCRVMYPTMNFFSGRACSGMATLRNAHGQKPASRQRPMSSCNANLSAM